MAVDLTTGSYDEEGVFSKHNEESSSKKFDVQDIFCSLKNFRTARVIKECLHEKKLVVEGHFLGDDKPAIIIVEKSPFVAEDLPRIFSSDCRLELKFRNNIYANYHVYPPSGFNGFDIKVIYPASEKDFSEFVDEPLRIINETPDIYTSVVLPYLNSVSSAKRFQVDQSNSTVIYEEKNLQPGFVLLEKNPEKCLCTTKHIQAICVVKEEGMLSLRDLTDEHIPLLSTIKKKCLDALSSKYSMPESKFICYIRYPPEHFPFHVLFETVEKDNPIPTEKAHHLESVIFNLRLIPDYYREVTLTYSVNEQDNLLKKLLPDNKQ